MKKVLSVALGLAGTALIAGVAYAVRQNGGVKDTMTKIKESPLVTNAMGKVSDLKQRFAANDQVDTQAAA